VSLKIIGVIVTITLSILAVPLAADAQPPAKVPRIGWLSSGPPLSEERRQQLPFVQGLRDLGWIEGQNIAIEWRYAEASTERLAAFAAELVQLGVDVIVAGDSRAIPPAQQATQTIPIVMTVSGAPVGSGFVASLARPGGNITGLSNATRRVFSSCVDLRRLWLHVSSPACCTGGLPTPRKS
jgi:putative ABC transport system substrate-binding protein